MGIREETIKRICELLNEDIEDQFHENELQAAIEGERCFCVTNKKHQGVFVKNIYYENVDVSDYVIVAYRMLVDCR